VNLAEQLRLTASSPLRDAKASIYKDDAAIVHATLTCWMPELLKRLEAEGTPESAHDAIKVRVMLRLAGVTQ
jgi:hypothetical protein